MWVRLTDEDRARLDGSCATIAARLPTLDEVMRAEQLSREAVWEAVRRGAYHAFRVARGRSWEWRLEGTGHGEASIRTSRRSTWQRESASS